MFKVRSSAQRSARPSPHNSAPWKGEAWRGLIAKREKTLNIQRSTLIILSLCALCLLCELCAFGAKRRKKINNHKKHQEKGTCYKKKSYLCTRKYVCRDSAITAFSVKKSRQNSSRHSQGAVNKHVAFSNHYMLLVFSAGIDCLFRKTPHYLLR